MPESIRRVPKIRFRYPPPRRDRDVDRCDYIMAEPLHVDGDGNIALSDTSGMGYADMVDRLAATRMA
jgi:hypothetical protein